MIIKKEYMGKNRKIILHLKCDECKKDFIGDKRCISRLLLSEHHFCSRKCSCSSSILKLKREKTNQKKYGHKAFTATKEFKQKFESNCVQKYGVRSHLEVPKILNKIKDTCLKRYGRETFVGSEEHISKLDYQDIVQKAWKTKLKNGKNVSSTQEEGVFYILCNEFGVDNIIRGKRILRQFVDFYIKPLALYVQVDGVYWHGLNRPLDEIKKFKTKQDKGIYKHMLRDQKLNNYCKDNGICLVRITDVQFDSMSANEILVMIKEG